MFSESPEYEIDEIEHWGQWSERQRLTALSAKDRGIDLVARHRDGSWIAVQCKCYAPDKRVSKSDIDSFLSLSQATDADDRPVFSMRWIVTTSPWTENASEQVDSLGSSVRRIDFLRHEYEKISEKLRQRPVRTPWPRQREAIDKVVAGLSHHDRGRMVMACGTGKTFTSLRIAEGVVPDGGRIAFVAPSIALVAQARREWLLHTARTLDCVVVCSDESSGGRPESAAAMRVSELECPVTTSPRRLGDLLDPDRGAEATRVVFCTYQSLHRICEAQQDHGAGAFDLVLCDEAHRTTGAISDTAGQRRDSGFQMVHDNDRLRAVKRLYMTATPRTYTLSSKRSLASRGIETVDMDDQHIYGPLLEMLSFKESVEQDLLTDYRVIVLGVHSGTVTIGVRKRLMALGDEAAGSPGGSRRGARPLVVTDEDLQRLLGTSLAINGMAEGDDLEVPQKLDRTIVFANSIARSKFYAQGLQDSQLRSLITRRRRRDGEQGGAVSVEAQHLDGTASAFDRGVELRKLAEAGTDQCARVVCNAKLLTEGVDVPSLDAVVFMEPRNSQVDIVQAVGRVMRRAQGKKLGYIVLPVPVRPGGDLSTELKADGSGYDAVAQVLLALQSHDSRLAETPAHFVKLIDTPPGPPIGGGGGEGGGEGGGGEGTQFVFDLHSAGDAIYAQVVAASGLGSSGKLVADDLGLAVTNAGARLSEGGLAAPLADALGLSVDGANSADICKVGALVLINACLLHRRLRDVPRFNDIADLATVTGAAAPGTVLGEGWRRILEHDYAPVFGPALKVLQQLPIRPFANEALRSLAECANRTADSLSEMGYDHAGPLYHRILPNAEAYGAFYTKNLTALMLARLAIDDSFADWSDPAAVSRLKIMDPACGTGTLLMAALRVLKQRTAASRDSGASPDAASPEAARNNESELHKTLVENVLYGLDINQPAIQFAASNFTLGAPTVDYRKMNLLTLRHGPQPDGSMMAGTLEVLGLADSDASLRNLVQPAGSRGLGAQLSDSGASFPTSGIDLVIMNPPFTNNVKKNSQFTPAQKKAMQQHELGLRDTLMQSDPEAAATIDANSIATYFTPIVERMLSSPGSTLALVLPATACTGSSGQAERRFRARHFRIETVVTSHDPKRINFSENTDIHECLLIARRREERSDPAVADPPTRFVSLSRMPTTPDEALAAADAISCGDLGDWGSVTLWPADRVCDGDWSPVQWYDGELAEIARSLETGTATRQNQSENSTTEQPNNRTTEQPNNTKVRAVRPGDPRRLQPLRARHCLEPDGRAVRGAFRRVNSSLPTSATPSGQGGNASRTLTGNDNDEQ